MAHGTLQINNLTVLFNFYFFWILVNNFRLMRLFSKKISKSKL